MIVPSAANAYKYVMCIELQEHNFKCALIEPKSREIVFYEEVEFESIDEAGLNNLLSDSYFNHDYQSVSISVSTNRHTIVPDAIFNASSASDIFKLNHSEPINNLDYRRLPELGLVSIYEIPLWIKSVFIKHFLRGKINHHSTVLLKGIFATNNFRPNAYLLKEQNLFYLALTDKNKLIYFNAFESSAIEDIVYYFLFTAEQKAIDSTNLPLTVFGLVENNKTIKGLRELLTSPVNLPNEEYQQKQFILTNSLLCV